MFFDILKRDMRRKKTMNLIILMFIIFAVTFISSSVNNLVAVSSSLDSFFDKAGVSDYVTFEKGENEVTAANAAEDAEGVTEVKTEEIIFISKAEFNDRESEDAQSGAVGMLSSIDRSIEHYFDENNNEITEVPVGGVYIRQSMLTVSDAKVGDTVTLTVDKQEKKFTIKGVLKDAVLGSMMMGNARYLISEKDFAQFAETENYPLYKGAITFINTADEAALEKSLAQCDGIIFAGNKGLFKFSYLMEMIVAGVLLIVSVCLIIISLVILRFTIGFTLSEEFREIGIMKAIGIRDTKIRGLYLVKYFAMSVVGAVVGFIASIPLGNLFLKQTAQSILMKSENSVLLGAVCSVAVIAVILLFCRLSTRKVKKFTPVDAIRNGTTGERYKKKGLIRLGGKKIRPVPFMAINDILSGMKRFGIMLATFTIGVLLITIILNVCSTMQSGKLLSWLSMADCEAAVIEKGSYANYMQPNGREILENRISQIEIDLKDRGYNAKCFNEAQYMFTVTHGDREINTHALEGIGTTTDQYTYLEGDAPQNENEIAMSIVVAEKLDVHVGDTVKVITPNGERECMVSALYQTMMSIGENIRIYSNSDIGFEYLSGFCEIQVKFADNPTGAELDKRLDVLRELYPDAVIKTAGEYVDYCVGGIAAYLSSVKYMVLLVVIIVNLLVAVLMEKSFLTKERGEIAMLKAIGFKNRTVIFWQTLRIGVIMVLATLLAIALSNPVGQLSMGTIFKMMGARNIIFDVNVLETYIIYPLIIFAATVFGVFLTTLSVRKVSSNEINSVE